MKGRFNGVKRKLTGIAIVVLLAALSISIAWADEKASGADLDSTLALIELLKDKGVINEKEASSFLDRLRLKAEASRQTVHILPSRDQEDIMKKVTARVTKDVTKQINDTQKEAYATNQYMARRSSLLEQEVEDLKEALSQEKSVREKSWANRIRFGGDIRLRHESVLYEKGNATDIEDPSDPDSYLNTTNDEHRQRVRLRLGLTATVVKPKDIGELFGLREWEKVNAGQVDVGVRVATGSVGNPVSTNYTLGDDDSTRSDIVLDRAYLQWSYKPREGVWGGKFPQAMVTGGIMANPWYTSYSTLIWDSDLAFEGLALNFTTDTIEVNPFKAFLTLGYFPIQESEWSQDDKYMLGAQVGFSLKPLRGWQAKLAAGYYEYYNVAGQLMTDTYRTREDMYKLQAMTPKFMQKGNTTFLMDRTTIYYDGISDDAYEEYGLASEFKLINITGQIDNTYFWPVYVTLYWDWVRNLGYDAGDMADKIGVSASTIKEWSGDTGYQLGLRVGYPKIKKRWDWSLYVAYRYLETDAVLDAYTDSDFMGGGTNVKGFIFGGELGLMKNVWLAARWMSGDEITDFEAVSSDQDEDYAVDILQVDLNAKF